jgi:hypothetical protein
MLTKVFEMRVACHHDPLPTSMEAVSPKPVSHSLRVVRRATVVPMVMRRSARWPSTTAWQYYSDGRAVRWLPQPGAYLPTFLTLTPCTCKMPDQELVLWKRRRRRLGLELLCGSGNLIRSSMM